MMKEVGMKMMKKKKITLESADGSVFSVEPEVAKEMKTVQSFIDDDSSITNSDVLIPLQNVCSRELARIVDFCNSHHKFSSSGNITLAEAYDKEFIKAMSHDELKDLIIATNYLNVDKLLDFLNQATADLIANKSVEFVRKFFGIENNFTHEEEATLREKYDWAFSGVDED